MALVRNIEEVKEYCSIVDLTMSFDSIKSYLRKAEKYVKECLGSTYYSALTASYEGDILTNAEKLLMPYVQDPIVNIALWLWLSGGQIRVSDKGVQIDHSGAMKTAFQWQIDEWREDLELSGFNGLDSLLQYLEDNKATFTIWAADSAAFTINKQFFNPDAVSFGNVINIANSRRTFIALTPYIEMAHDMELKPTLGDDFYDELKAANTAGNMSSNQKLLLPLLKKCEVYFAMAQAYGALRFVINSTGVRVHETLNSIDNSNTSKVASNTDAAALATRMEGYGRFYLKALVKMLNDNADNYNTWKNSDKYVDPTETKESSTYIGDAWVGL